MAAVPNPIDVPVENLMNKLAAELAAGLSPTKDIAKRYMLTVSQLARLMKDTQFRAMYKEAKTLWESDTNSRQRIRVKAAMALEDSILPIYSIIHNENSPPPAKIDAFKQLAVLADAVPRADKGGGQLGDKFSVTINLGDNVPSDKIVLDVVTPEVPADE